MTIGRIPSVEGGIQPTIFDAKADLLTATAADTPARLAVGTNGQYLKADSTTSTGLAWATLPTSGKVLQVVTASTTTETTFNTTSYTDTNLSASITPSATSSKVLVMISQNFEADRQNVQASGMAQLLRGATAIHVPGNDGTLDIYVSGATAVYIGGIWSLIYLDSPNTTSATTYKTQAKVRLTTNSGQLRAQYNSTPSYITLMEIGA